MIPKRSSAAVARKKIRTYANILINTPEETEEDVRKNRRLDGEY